MLGLYAPLCDYNPLAIPLGMISHCLGWVWKVSDACRIFAAVQPVNRPQFPLIMKTTTTTPTTRKTNRKSSKAAPRVSSKATSLESKKPLPKDVYFRLRYRLALQANNLGSAKKFANILKRMEAPLEVKGETFKTMAKAIEYVDSLKAPKATPKAAPVAKKVREPKAASDSLAEVLKQINEMATKYNWSKAEVAKMTMAAIDKVGA